MLSTPPAMYSSPSSTVMARAESMTACRPLAQSRFTVTPGVVGGRPDSSAAKRATLRLSSPAWLTQPSTTSLISRGSIALRATTSRITSAARSSGRTVARRVLDHRHRHAVGREQAVRGVEHLGAGHGRSHESAALGKAEQRIDRDGSGWIEAKLEGGARHILSQGGYETTGRL